MVHYWKYQYIPDLLNQIAKTIQDSYYLERVDEVLFFSEQNPAHIILQCL